MKKTKIALTLVCAILLVAASVMGTLAYLTDTTGPVTNTFTVGENVAITLDEADVDEYGNLEYKTENDDDGNPILKDRVKANEYKLIPGHTYTKDPTVHVTGADCYVFVTVDNDIAGVETASTEGTIATQIAANGWEPVAGYTNLYVYVGHNTDKSPKVVSGSTTTPADLVVFEMFKIDGNKTHDDLKGFAKDQQTAGDITIKAYAIQADSVTFDDAADLWNLAKPTGDANLAKPVPTPTPDT